MMDALAVLGVLATISAGASLPIVAIVVLGVAIALPERRRTHPIFRRAVLVAAIGVLVVDAYRASLVDCVVCVQIARIATRRGAEVDRQIAVLSFLGAALAGVLGGGAAYG